MKAAKDTAATAKAARMRRNNNAELARASNANGSTQLEEDSRRNELIAKSAKLFREQGYDRTTVRDIAAAVGMQAGSWFYHFKSKQEILVAVMEQGMARSLKEIEDISAQSLPPRDAFRALVLTHLKTLLAPHNDFIPVLLYEARSLDDESRAKIVAMTDRYEAVWDEVIEALQQSGGWAAPTGLDRLFLFGALNWTAQWFRPGAGITLEDLADQAVQFLLRTPETARGSKTAKKKPAVAAKRH
ncbi:MAG TPA: TetR/AcrR family transcriptional regulator [Noviherbaspirillum sp.]|nr:TetR/AcrR family transcriptional regulator [Noviherbaspirillum sp.]